MGESVEYVHMYVHTYIGNAFFPGADPLFGVG